MKKIKIEMCKLISKALLHTADLLMPIKIHGDASKSLEDLYNLYTPELITFDNIENNEEYTYDLSLIVPVYNSEKVVSECVKSLVNQKTEYKYEVILIDDGSTDNSLNVIKDISEKWDFLRVYSQKNSGISAARNRGIELSQGRYIGFIDNDDKVEDTFVQQLLDCAFNSGADIVKCGHYRYDVENQRIMSTVRYSNVLLSGDIGKEILNIKGFVWEGIYKRQLWSDIRFPKGYWYEDIILRMIIMRLANKIECIDKTLYYYNMHTTNASKTVWKQTGFKCLDQLYLIKQLVEYPIHSKDSMLSYCLLHELGEILWLRTRKLSNKIRRKVFFVAKEIVEQYVTVEEYDKYEMKIRIAYLNGSYLSWKMLCFSEMLKVKIQNEYGE